MQQEQWLRLGLVGLGVPAAAKVFAWSLYLCALVLLLSFSLILVLAVCVLWLIGRSVARSDLSWDRDHPTWRYGLFGFGLYDKYDMRIDPHYREGS